MRRRICLLIYRDEIVDLNIPLSKVKFAYFLQLNSKEFNVIAIEKSYEHDGIFIYLTHPEFEEVPVGGACEMFSVEAAKHCYPFLFVDTNPLLYRRFK